MSCPICGIVAKETRQCPKYAGKPVCAAHCYLRCGSKDNHNLPLEDIQQKEN